MKAVKTGITHTFEATITPQQSAINVGSGAVEVLGTPAMIALMEKASNLLMDPYFDKGETSVGTHVDVRHMKPTAIGATIKVSAKLTECVDGRKLTFEIWAEDEEGEVGRGTLKRAVINKEKFMARLK